RAGRQAGRPPAGQRQRGGAVPASLRAAQGGGRQGAGGEHAVVELFEDQPQEYRDRVLPPAVTARVSVEEASRVGWAHYVGVTGQSLGMRSFGASAPLKALVKKFGFTPEHVVAAAREQLAKAAANRR